MLLRSISRDTLWAKSGFLFFLSACLTACTNGPLKVFERTYLAVPSGENSNYYRITVRASTQLSDAKYSSAWFPAYAVDSLYGFSNVETDIKHLKTEQELQDQLNLAIKESHKKYLDVAKDPSKSEEEVEKHLLAQRRVRASAGADTPLPKGAVEFEYDPSRNLVLRHAGQKRIFTLSANPNEVTNKIQTAAGTMQTGVQLSRLFDAIKSREKQREEEFGARLSVDKKLDAAIAKQMDGILSNLGEDTKLERDDLLAEIEALLLVVETSQ